MERQWEQRARKKGRSSCRGHLNEDVGENEVGRWQRWRYLPPIVEGGFVGREKSGAVLVLYRCVGSLGGEDGERRHRGREETKSSSEATTECNSVVRLALQN